VLIKVYSARLLLALTASLSSWQESAAVEIAARSMGGDDFLEKPAANPRRCGARPDEILMKPLSAKFATVISRHLLHGKLLNEVSPTVITNAHSSVSSL